MSNSTVFYGWDQVHTEFFDLIHRVKTTDPCLNKKKSKINHYRKEKKFYSYETSPNKIELFCKRTFLQEHHLLE